MLTYCSSLQLPVLACWQEDGILFFCFFSFEHWKSLVYYLYFLLKERWLWLIEDLGRNQINSQAIELHSVLLINTKTTGETTKQATSWEEVHKHITIDVTVNWWLQSVSSGNGNNVLSFNASEVFSMGLLSNPLGSPKPKHKSSEEQRVIILQTMLLEEWMCPGGKDTHLFSLTLLLLYNPSIATCQLQCKRTPCTSQPLLLM